MAKNKLSTPSYFVKRLKDSGFLVFNVFKDFHIEDPRKWSLIVDPGFSTVFITCYHDKNQTEHTLFELNDGCNHIPKNYHLQTDSMDVVIKYLLEHGVKNNAKERIFYKQKTV